MAVQFATRMKSIKEEAEANLKMAAQKMKEQYDRSKRVAPEYKAGDMVLLNMKNLCTTRQMKKLENLRDDETVRACAAPVKFLAPNASDDRTRDAHEASSRAWTSDLRYPSQALRALRG